MSELKVTGGEWMIMELHGNKSSIPICPGAGRGGITIATANYRKGSGISKEEAIANAHLLAASKRLYEQLAYMAAQHKCGCKHPACKRCEDDAENEAVLAAARGEKEVEDE